MKFVGAMLLGLVIGFVATVYFATTQPGRHLVAWTEGRLKGVGHAATVADSKAAAQAALQQVLDHLKNAAASAQDYASKVADGARLDDLADELEASARKGGAQAGALWVQAQRAALAAAERIPKADSLGDTLGGWEQQLAAYEMAQHAGDKDENDQKEQERKIAATFANPPTVASASSSSMPGKGKVAGLSFQPMTPFYKCPVIQVSNSGPTAPDRALTAYTPWVKTAAGTLIRAPVSSACLSSGFGSRVQNGKTESHPGVDYYNREGGPIFAAGDGVVTFADVDPSYGYSVLIDHGAGVEGHYAHMVPGSLKVHKGQHVKLGQQIGSMGHSGRAYAVHLHYELRFAGQLVDPLYVGQPGLMRTSQARR